MRLKNLDLIVITAVVAMNVIWSLLSRPGHLSAVGIALALPLVFFLPGYALTKILFHGQSLNWIYCITLSLGLSMAIDIVSGFVLNLFPIGLRAMPWAAFLGILTLVFSFLGTYLLKKSSKGGIRLPTFHSGIHRYFLVGFSVVVAIVVTILAIQFSATSTAEQPHPGFTQLWMLSSPQDNKCAVRLGVRSFEATSVTYRVVMTINDTQVGEWSPVALVPQEEWDRLVPISFGPTGSAYIEVKLYRLDKPEAIYRDVHMTLNSLETGGKNRKIQC